MPRHKRINIESDSDLKKITLEEFDKFPRIDKHVYVYLRVSTDEQDTEAQLLGIYNFCNKESLYPPSTNIFIDKGISGKISWLDRGIGSILSIAKKGDIIILPELSRSGRNSDDVGEIMGICARKGITIKDVKNGLSTDNLDLKTKMMKHMYSMFAEVERDQISKRVKEGLLKAKELGHLTGRKRGIKHNKLDGKEEIIKELLRTKNKYNTAKELGVNSTQLNKFINNKNIIFE